MSLGPIVLIPVCVYVFFSSRRRHTRFDCDWSSDVCSSDLHRFVSERAAVLLGRPLGELRLVTAHLGNGCSAAAIDRKSTRLNSSHSQISYAVFCLKKKNKKRPPARQARKPMLSCHASSRSA